MDWYEHYEALKRAVSQMESSFPDADFRPEGNWKDVLRWCAQANRHLAEVSVHAVQEAFNDGVTKKDIALVLDVPPSTFRGMRKTR